jgi:outer membrane receptor protein involved in Fe transport
MVLRLRCMWRIQRVALALVVLTALAWPARAQVVGQIQGTVSDAQGGVLPGVSLTLRNTETGAVRSTVTESDGQYRLAGLQPGTYSLKAELQGFATVEVERMTITIGLQLQQDFKLQLQSLQETVTVTGEAPVIEVTRTEVAQVITQEQIETLPMADRQPASLVLLLPGTNMDNTQVRRSQANIGAGGINNQMNAYFLDGSSNWSTNSGQQHAEMPQLAIREFRVNVAQASAEHGGNVAGLVSIVTRSGTNRFSGEALEYFKNQNMQARDKNAEDVGAPKPDYKRNQWGLAFGGPVVKDKVHFYSAIEYQTENKSFTVNSGQPQFYSKLEGVFPTDYLRHKYFLRGDWQISQAQSLFVRYGKDWEHIDCEGCGGTNAAFNQSYVESPRTTNVIGHTWVISNRALNEFRVQYPAALHSTTGPPGTSLWDRPGEFPAERFNGYTQVYNFPSMHWGSSTGSLNFTKRFELKEDYSYSAGSHQWKFGAEYARYISPEDVISNLGTWTFSTDQFFDGSAAAIAALRNPTTFTASFPNVVRELKNYWINGYGQDEWKPFTNLTVNLGVRYDLQYRSFNNQLNFAGREQLRQLIDPTTRHDNNNIGPRVGMAWDVRNDTRTLVRAAYGRFYQYLPQGGLRNELGTLLQSTVSITNPTYPDPYGGRSPQSFVTVSARPNVSVLDDKIHNMSGDTVTAGVSQQLRPNLALHVDGVYTNLRDFARTWNINAPNTGVDTRTLDAATAARTAAGFNSAQLNALRPLANWGNVTQLTANGWSNYRALYVRLDKRMSNRYMYLVSYTRDWTKNNVASPVADYYHPDLDTGPDGRKHTVVASGTARLPLDLTLGAVWTVRSALPYSALAGVDLNGDGVSNNDYVPGTTRNQAGRDDAATAQVLQKVNEWRAVRNLSPIPASQLQSSNFNRFDIRVSRSINLGGARSVDLVAQVFNVFGRDNLVGGTGGGAVNTATSNAFGKYTIAAPRQDAEVGISFKF